MWDASTGTELVTLIGHTDQVNSVAFSTDDTHIVSGSHDKSVRVWDASTGTELATSDVPAPAWPKSPGFGPALRGSGFFKSSAEPPRMAQAWLRPALAQAGAYSTWPT